MADASISPASQEVSQKMADAKNSELCDPTLDPNMFREPKRYVYVYSIADRDLSRELPPQIRSMLIPSRGDERYVLVQRISDPFNQPDVDQNGKQICHYIDGRRIAMDICNPDNTGLDQDAKLNPAVTFSEGNNYSKYGVFWSLNNPPTEPEILAAEKRKEDYYRALLAQAKVWESSNPKLLAEGLTPNHYLAANYFGEEYSWCRVVKRPSECPNCGESIKKGVAYHKNDMGTICVIDWDRTIAAGVKTENQRPKPKVAA